MPIGFPFGSGGGGGLIDAYGPLKLWAFANIPYFTITNNSINFANRGNLVGSLQGNGTDIAAISYITPFTFFRINTPDLQVTGAANLPDGFSPNGQAGDSPFRTRSGSYFVMANQSAGLGTRLFKVDSANNVTTISFPNSMLNSLINGIYYIEEIDRIIVCYRVDYVANMAFAVSDDDGATWQINQPPGAPNIGYSTASHPLTLWRANDGTYYATDPASSRLWATSDPLAGWVDTGFNTGGAFRSVLHTPQNDICIGVGDNGLFRRWVASNPDTTFQTIPRANMPDANWPLPNRFYVGPAYHAPSGRYAAFANGLFPAYSEDDGLTWKMATITLGNKDIVTDGSTTQTNNIGRKSCVTANGQIFYVDNYGNSPMTNLT